MNDSAIQFYRQAHESIAAARVAFREGRFYAACKNLVDGMEFRRRARVARSFESCELGGTVVRGLMLRVGDLVFCGPQDTEGMKVTRIWAVYRDGELSCVKLSAETGIGWHQYRRGDGSIDSRPRLHTGGLHTVATDPRIQFLPGVEGQTMADGEWAQEAA